MPSIEINGQQVELFCGINEHQTLWKITGKNLLVGESVVSGVNPGNIMQVVSVMSRGKVSPEQVAEKLTSTRKLFEAFKAVVDTVNDGMEEAITAEENPSPAA